MSHGFGFFKKINDHGVRYILGKVYIFTTEGGRPTSPITNPQDFDQEIKVLRCGELGLVISENFKKNETKLKGGE